MVHIIDMEGKEVMEPDLRMRKQMEIGDKGWNK